MEEQKKETLKKTLGEIAKVVAPNLVSAVLIALLLLYGFSTTISKLKGDFKVLDLKILKLKESQPGKRIGPGTVIAPTNMVSKKEFSLLLKELKAQRAFLSTLSSKG